MQTGAGGMEHRMLPLADLAKVLAAGTGVADGAHIVLAATARCEPAGST